MSLLLIFAASDSVALAESGSALAQAVVQASNPFRAFVDEASKRFAIPVNWIGSVINVESAGDVHAKSPKGAMGLMQIMPATWAKLRERYNLGNDPYDSHDNILAGTAYLRELLDWYGSPGVFAAYNAGPSRYEEHLAGGPLPGETRAYVAKLGDLLTIELPPRWASSGQSSAAATLFVTRSDLMKTRDRLLALMTAERCHDRNLGRRCIAHSPSAYWHVRPSIGFGRIAMTKCAGSQADGVWAMPSARALLVASLLTEPPFGCLGPSGNDRYRKRSEAVGASPVGSQVAAALSETGDRETTTAGRAHGSLGQLACSCLDRFGSIAMNKRAGSQVFVCSTMQVARADGVWAMPSARALLVASLLTEPPFGCLGPSGNDRYRKRSEAVGASPVGSQVAAALSETGDRETTTAGRQDGKIKEARRSNRKPLTWLGFRRAGRSGRVPRLAF
ncbi:lytic transglycosylase domain-containing protein [Bradyrhizobium sp. STM 3561]|uniref:lytic transglycosylase domain-containing protein n=1 Tax=Bradyrhizobium sp. STM 3561 TaxID=578923 RepID=UPI00388F4139